MNLSKLVFRLGKSRLLCVLTFLIFNISFTYAQSCNSELIVENNRNARSVSENDPTRFHLNLTNNSSKTQTYTINAKIFSGICKVDGKKAQNTSSNNGFEISIFQNKNRKNTFTIPARSTISFQALVSVISGTPVNEWSCIEIQAYSVNCSNEDNTAIVKVLVADNKNY